MKADKKIQKPGSIETSKNSKDYGIDPYVARKNELARELIRKAGIPENFKSKK